MRSLTRKEELVPSRICATGSAIIMNWFTMQNVVMMSKLIILTPRSLYQWSALTAKKQFRMVR